LKKLLSIAADQQVRPSKLSDDEFGRRTGLRNACHRRQLYVIAVSSHEGQISNIGALNAKGGNSHLFLKPASYRSRADSI